MNRPANLMIEQTGGRVESWRTACFVLLSCMLVIAFRNPLVTLISTGLGPGHNADQYSHLAVIPVVCLYLIWRKRKVIFAAKKWSILPGIALVLSGFSWLVLAKLEHARLTSHDYACALMAGFVTLVIANFILCFGTTAFRLARFPLLMLILMVPFPSWFLQRTVSVLQEGSATVTAFLLGLTSAPFLREGLVFHLPQNLNIVISDDCSGIRSSIALLIAGLVMSDVFLCRGWTKLLLNLAVLPLSLFKNGLRIATLSLLSVYVDRRFISGDLHRDGGIFFYLIALVILAFMLWGLRKAERLFAAPQRQPEENRKATDFASVEAPLQKETLIAPGSRF
jgi:exosortase